MNIRYHKKFEAEVATASLNDIMFFLLLFFLIISTVANPNVLKVLLPESKANQSLNKQPVNLTVTEGKQYLINNKPIPKSSLEASLIAECGNISEPTVVIHIHRSLSIQDLVDVMEIGARNKLKMVLATSKK